MPRRTLLFILLAIPLAAQIPVIFDTDMGNDIDDALALAMLHAFETRGESTLLGVTLTKDNPWAPRYVSAINTYYGRGAIPLGMVKDGKTPDEGKFNRAGIEEGKHPYGGKTEDAVALLRRLLEAQPDKSVALIQVGFSTNLARLLDTPRDRALVAGKVKLLSIMAGNFAEPRGEFNVVTDVPAAQKLAREWPTPAVWSGFEVGRTIKYPASSIERDFGPPGAHPVAGGYRAYMKMPYDRETWDLTSVLYAVRPDGGYFDLSEAGDVAVDAKGLTSFTPRAGGLHRYLKVNGIQRARILEAFVWLASQPAGGRPHGSLKK
jgi:inosine-uridine nucleoside N-ribohydrolase